MIKVGIVGGTGYTGVELLRLLVLHPEVSLQVITSRADAGTPVNQMFPSLRGLVDLLFVHPDEAHLERCDLVFFATPNGIAMQQARALLDAGEDPGPEVAGEFLHTRVPLSRQTATRSGFQGQQAA